MIESGFARLLTAGIRKMLALAALVCVLPPAALSDPTTYSYDALGRLTKVVAPNGADRSTRTYSYDGAGNRENVVANILYTPTGLTATAVTSAQIRLNWTPNAGGAPIAYYKVYRGGSYIASPDGPPFDDYPLTAETTYSYTVSAVDASGTESLQSATASATTPPAPDYTAPSAPTNLQGVAVSGTQVNLSWNASQDNPGGSGVAGYEIFRNNGPAPMDTSSGTTYSDATASPATTYSYKVRAYDSAGNRSAFSNQISVITPDTVPPSAPGSPTFTAITVDSATASWAAASDNVGVTGYRYSLNGGSTWANVGNVLSVNLTGLASGTSYTMLVEARDANGNWGPMSSGSFTTYSWITIATGIKPPRVLAGHTGTYACEYVIDPYYWLEYEACYVIAGGAVYSQGYSPPTPPSVATGYQWNGASLVVQSNYYGTY